MSITTAPQTVTHAGAMAATLSGVPSTMPEKYQAFEAARRIKGYCLQHGLPIDEPEAYRDALSPLCVENDIDSDSFIEEFCLAWFSVKHPTGQNAVKVAFAAVKSGNSKLIKGVWPTKNIQKQASIVIHIARRLAGENNDDFFMSCRDLADVLNTQPTRVGQIINMLVARGYLQKIGAAHTGKAQSFRLKSSNTFGE